jgi:hypothetical protein
MADDKIVHRISLEGADDVVKKLKQVGDTGADAFKKVKQYTDDGGSGVAKFGNAFATLTGKSEAGYEATKKFRETIHELHPALDSAGIGLGQLSAFISASRAGIAGLAVATGGSLLTALEKAGDAAGDQASRIGAFAGSPERGKEARESLGGIADGLQVPSSALTGPYEQILRANQRQTPANQLPAPELQKTLATLFNGAAADRVPLDKAVEGITSLLTDLREKGQLSPEAAKTAEDTFPTLMKRLIDNLQTSHPGAINFSTPQVFKSLADIGPQASQDAAASRAAFPDGIDTAWTKVKAASEKLAEATTGGHVVATALDGAALFMDDVARGIKHAKEALKNPDPTLTRITNPFLEETNRSAGRGAPVQPALPSAASDAGSRPSLDAFDAEHAGGLKIEAEKLGDSLKSLTPSVDGAQKTFDDFNKKGAAQLDVIGSKLSLQQAKIDFQHKPEETEIKLGRDKLAVENADIAAQSARLNAQEVNKSKQLAALAPEQAQNAVRDAGANRDKALSNFFKSRGVDTTALDAQNASEAEANQLADAETALKVAQVNRRYAGLEPKKAELAGEKAETDIRSADFVKQDTTLTLAKDKAGQNLSSDVAGLRYAQAQLDTQNKIAQFGDAEVDILKSILNVLALKGGGDKGSPRGDQTPAGDGSKPQSDQGSGPLNTDRASAGDPLAPTLQGDAGRKGGQSPQEVEAEQAQTKRYFDEFRAANPNARSGVFDAGPFSKNQSDTFEGSSSRNDPNYAPITNGPRSDAPGAVAQPQQFAGLGDKFQSFIDSVNAALSRADKRDLDQTGKPAAAMGIRGEAAPEGDMAKSVDDLGKATETADTGLTSFTQALADAADKLSSVPVPSSDGATQHAAEGGQIHAAAGGHIVDATGGGHLQGPGTGTSDSIPIWGSHNEFMVSEKGVKAAGLPLLHFINAGGFAEGGPIDRGASTFSDRINAMGMRSIDVPHLAIGGMPDHAPLLSADSSAFSERGSSGPGPLHPVTMNFPWGGSIDGLHAEPGAMEQLRRAAVDGQTFSTGKKPGWYGGRG